MNSTQRMVMDVLTIGAQPAVNILYALKVRGWQRPIEYLYVELVAMEAADLARVEGVYDGAGRRLYGAWALGRKPPKFEPRTTSMTDLLEIFGRPSLLDDDDSDPPTGVLVHRCR